MPLGAIIWWTHLESQHLAIHAEVPSPVTGANHICFVSIDTPKHERICDLGHRASESDYLLTFSRSAAPIYVYVTDFTQSALYRVYRHAETRTSLRSPPSFLWKRSFVGNLYIRSTHSCARDWLHTIHTLSCLSTRLNHERIRNLGHRASKRDHLMKQSRFPAPGCSCGSALSCH